MYLRNKNLKQGQVGWEAIFPTPQKSVSGYVLFPTLPKTNKYFPTQCLKGQTKGRWLLIDQVRYASVFKDENHHSLNSNYKNEHDRIPKLKKQREETSSHKKKDKTFLPFWGGFWCVCVGVGSGLNKVDLCTRDTYKNWDYLVLQTERQLLVGSRMFT